MFVKLDLQVLDYVLKNCTPSEVVVFLYVFRKTVGYQKEEEWISNRLFAQDTNLAVNTIKKARRGLKKQGLIDFYEREGKIFYMIKEYQNLTEQASKNDIPYQNLIQNISKNDISQLVDTQENSDILSKNDIEDHQNLTGGISKFGWGGCQNLMKSLSKNDTKIDKHKIDKHKIDNINVTSYEVTQPPLTTQGNEGNIETKVEAKAKAKSQAKSEKKYPDWYRDAWRFWCAIYREKYKAPYLQNGKNMKIFYNILEQIGEPELVREVLQGYLVLKDSWYVKNFHRLEYLLSDLQKILVMVKNRMLVVNEKSIKEAEKTAEVKQSICDIKKITKAYEIFKKQTGQDPGIISFTMDVQAGVYNIDKILTEENLQKEKILQKTGAGGIYDWNF